MAISVPAVSQCFSNTTGANVTVTFPTASMLLGDWIYLFGGHFRRAGVNIGPTTGVWETVYSENAGGSTNAFGCWRKQWNGAETSVACYGGGTAGDGDVYGRIILRESGSLHGAVVAVTGASTNPNAGSIATSAGDCVLIAAQSAVSDTSPGTVTSHTTVNGNANGTLDMSMSIGYRLNAPNPNDPAAWSSWSTGNWRTLTIAISPAVVGTGVLADQSAGVAGTGVSSSTGTGTLTAQDAAIAGAGISSSTGTGGLDAQPAAMVGVGVSGSTGGGTLAAQAADVQGSDTPVSYQGFLCLAGVIRTGQLKHWA